MPLIRRIAAGLAVVSIATLAATPAAAYDWLQFNGDPAHSGNNTAETVLAVGNVASLAQKYPLVQLRGISDGAPVFLEGVPTPGGIKDLLFVTTTSGWIQALDAATGVEVWSKQYGTGTCTSSNGSACVSTSSPAIDPNRQFVYGYGLDGNVHKYAVGTGLETMTGGWPQVATLKPSTEKSAGALGFATSSGVTYLYAVHGGYPGDAGDYQGHVTAINLATGVQEVFNTVCSNQPGHLTFADANCNANTDSTKVQSAVWARPGVIYDAGTDRVFLGTGNGHNNLSTNWSESVLAIHPDGTGANGPLDSYTPTNVGNLDGGDTDLGSAAPAILPVPANSNVQHLAVQGGKDARLRLINIANLSSQPVTPGPGHTGGEVQLPFAIPQGGGVFSQQAVWVNPSDATTWVFVGTSGGVSGLRLNIDTSGNPSLSTSSPSWTDTAHGSATSPLVANGVLYTFGGGLVHARNPATGALLWTSPSLGGGTHWQSPIVANGAVYVADNGGHLAAFALPSSPPVFTTGNSAAFQLGVAGAFAVRATGAPSPTLSEAGTLPGGVTFTAATGALAGTPTITGTFPLQFTASNGVLPDAIQNFTLTVNTGPPPEASLTFTDPTCSSFALTGTPPAQTLSCVGGGTGGVPVCAPTANPPSPAVGQQTTISANCSNQPNSNGYVWTGGTCVGTASPTCTVAKGRVVSITYAVSARNAAGAGPAASITISWH